MLNQIYRLASLVANYRRYNLELFCSWVPLVEIISTIFPNVFNSMGAGNDSYIRLIFSEKILGIQDLTY